MSTVVSENNVLESIVDTTEVVTPDVDTAKNTKLELLHNRLQKMGVSGLNEVSVQDFRLFATHIEFEVSGIKKTISITDFRKLLEETSVLDVKIENLQLPYGTFLLGKSGNDLNISCYYPERIADIKHIASRSGNPISRRVPIPNIIISHKLKLDKKEWRVMDTRYLCTDKRVNQISGEHLIWSADPSKGIYKIPFSNMYPEGRMCYGNNTMPVRFSNNLMGLDYYYQILEAAPFNDDLNFTNVVGYTSMAAYLTAIAGKEKFDYRLLRGYRAPASQVDASTPSAPGTLVSELPVVPAEDPLEEDEFIEDDDF